MALKEQCNFSQKSIYELLFLDAEYPDKIISFADRYMHWCNYNSIIKCFSREIKKAKKYDFNILDVGCGMGYLAFKLQEVNNRYNLRITGIDKYKSAIDFANARKGFLNRKDCYFELMDACSLRFDNDFFDIVIISQVLEHLKEPWRAIKEIYRVLKKGGLAIITTPNKRQGLLNNIARAMLSAFFNYKKITFSEYRVDKNPAFNQEAIHHISVKNHKEWTKIFKQEGFSLQTKIGTGGVLYNYKFFEKYRILFGLMIIFDTFLGNSPFSYLWQEKLLCELRK